MVSQNETSRQTSNSFKAPSLWWSVAKVLVVILAVLLSLCAAVMLVGGLVLLGAVHGTDIGGCVGRGADQCIVGSVGTLLLVLGAVLAVCAALYWWAVKSLRRGSNRARWIVGILTSLSLPYSLASVLVFHTGVMGGVISVAFNGCIFYGLLIDPKVRAAFSNSTTLT